MKLQNTNLNTVTLGGVTLCMSASIKILTAQATTTQYDSMKCLGVNYVVPAGKKLVIRAVRVTASGAGGNQCKIGYGDNAVDDTAAAPTNSVVTNLAGYAGDYVPYSIASAGAVTEEPMFIEIPAGKYPFIFSAGNPFITILAEEV